MPRDRPRGRAGRSRRRRGTRGRAGAPPCRTPRRPRRRASGRSRRTSPRARTSRSSVCPPLASRQRNGGSSGSGSRYSDATCPCRWSTGASGSRRDHASAFAAETPTRSAPTSPGPRVTATRSTPSSESRPRRAPGARPARRARDADATRPRERRRRSARAARPATRRRSTRISPVVRDDGRGRLVTRRLDSEDHATGCGWGSRHMISASSRLSV